MTKPPESESKRLIILILGLMTALSPFSIDMYLPALQSIATELGSTTARVSLSLSSYFIGISFGQLIYGPLLDRYGRKRPLYVGLAIYIIATLCCLLSRSAESLIAWRFVQALGGCAAGVASMAMVRDLFTLKESAKVFSLLILILGTSPLFAPTIGGYLAVACGWRSVFVVLASMATLLLAAVRFLLAESHTADPSVTLRFKPIAQGFLHILRNAQFSTYVLSQGVAFSALFVYLVGSPVIFLGTFGVSSQVYGWIFATIAAGFILSSQLNVALLKHFSNEHLLLAGMFGQVTIGLFFLFAIFMGWFGLVGSVAMFFLFMCCFGLTNPNAGALALAPFSKNAGRASALMGFLQMGIGAVASTTVGLFGIASLLPVVAIMAVTTSLALAILLFGGTFIRRQARPATAESITAFRR